MSNFDYFLSVPQFATFAEVAVFAEKNLPIDPSACVRNCRRALELAVKWMYSVDISLGIPWDDKLISLINSEEFRSIVDEKLLFRMEFIRKMGNNAAIPGKQITKEQATFCLQNLFVFLDFVAYCYKGVYKSPDAKCVIK